MRRPGAICQVGYIYEDAFRELYAEHPETGDPEEGAADGAAPRDVARGGRRMDDGTRQKLPRWLATISWDILVRIMRHEPC